MVDERYNRWQGLAIAQFSVAVALVSGLSVVGLGAGLSLVQSREFIDALPFKSTFAISMLLLFLAALSCCGAVITRTLDFRLTARKVRKDRNREYKRPLTIFWLAPDEYGHVSWGLFWTSCLSFAAGAILLVICVGTTYATSWH